MCFGRMVRSKVKSWPNVRKQVRRRRLPKTTRDAPMTVVGVVKRRGDWRIVGIMDDDVVEGLIADMGLARAIESSEKAQSQMMWAWACRDAMKVSDRECEGRLS